MQPQTIFGMALLALTMCLAFASEPVAHGGPVALDAFYEAKTEDDLPLNRRGSFDFIRDKKQVYLHREPVDFDVLVNATGVLKFSFKTEHKECEYGISFNYPQQDAQIRIFPVTTSRPKDMQFVQGKEEHKDMVFFKRLSPDSPVTFDFVVDATEVRVGLTEHPTHVRVAEAEENSDETSSSTDDVASLNGSEEKTFHISAWKTWDYAYGGPQQRAHIHLASANASAGCNAILFFPSSTAFVFATEEMPEHLRPTTTQRPTADDRSGRTKGAVQHSAAAALLPLVACLLLLTA